MASRKEQKEQARQQRLAAEREATQRAARRRRLQIGGVVTAVVVVGVIVGVAVASSGGSGNGGGTGPPPRLSTAPISTLGALRPAPSPGLLGPEGVPIPTGPALTSTASQASGQTVDGIPCGSSEQTVFHIHAHVTIFVNGSARQIPQGVGIVDNTCLYWLHTHQPDGIIHVESGVQRTYTLGDFFDIWGQQLGRNRVGPATGAVTAFYNGAVYRGNPRDIPLNSYAQIQLDVGHPLIAPEKISYSGTGL
jgi:hypothetical protein